MQELFFQFDILWFFILISYSLFKILFFGKDAKNKSHNKVIQCQYLTSGTFQEQERFLKIILHYGKYYDMNIDWKFLLFQVIQQQSGEFQIHTRLNIWQVSSMKLCKQCYFILVLYRRRSIMVVEFDFHSRQFTWQVNEPSPWSTHALWGILGSQSKVLTGHWLT